MMTHLIVANKNIPLTPAGFLCHVNDWSEEVARFLATEENITLSPDHFAIIHLLRQFYLDHETIPPLRSFISLLKKQLGDELGNSIRLHQLFPSPLKQACRIGGLPKPKHCM